MSNLHGHHPQQNDVWDIVPVSAREDKTFSPVEARRPRKRGVSCDAQGLVCCPPMTMGKVVSLNVVILAAGLGTRLGRPHPKSLTPLADGRSILRHQLDHLASAFPGARITVVVGFKMDLIMEAAANDASFVYNEVYDQTNTSKSLLKALKLAPPGGVLWLNGDVVFVPKLLDPLRDAIVDGGSFVAVNTESVADEEIKYTLNDNGYIVELSKQVVGGLGEAVGINYIADTDRDTLITHLERCDDNDYFERGLETAIETAGLRVAPVDISAYGCVEVDFEPDLARALALEESA